MKKASNDVELMGGCQREADLLEKEYEPEDEQSEKKWWAFWK